jgi:hypothetical protein
VTDLVYTLVQLLHNLGAVAVVGGPAAALTLAPPAGPLRRRLALAVLLAWALQAATGAGFALASWRLKGALPEIAGVALAALAIKLAATAGGIVLGAFLLRSRRGGSPRAERAAWAASLALAVAAISAAAFLRWYL